MKKTATVKNDFGVAVKKCCMSCAHRDCTRLWGTRFCNELHMEVGRYTVCGQWQMSDQMKAAGKGGGKIKRRKYLAYLASIREEEALARQLGAGFLPKSVEAIRREFEQEHGSIFINI